MPEARPMAMASVVFGELSDPRWYDADAHAGDPVPYRLDRVRFWNLHQRRVEGLVRRADIESAATTLQAEGFDVVATTPVGLSFAGTTALFRRHFAFARTRAPRGQGGEGVERRKAENRRPRSSVRTALVPGGR